MWLQLTLELKSFYRLLEIMFIVLRKLSFTHVSNNLNYYNIGMSENLRQDRYKVTFWSLSNPI